MMRKTSLAQFIEPPVGPVSAAGTLSKPGRRLNRNLEN
jgi:hypothetical protein